jgi:predicted NBD/HSP70 family sugar kinase
MTVNTIRTENRRKILQLLIRERELTIAEISRALEISIPTVTKNVEQLVEEGVAEKAGVSDAVVGRKPVVIKFLPDAYYAVGVEFSMRTVTMVLTNLDAAIICERTLQHIEYADIDALMHRIHGEFLTVLDAQQIPLQEVLGIGFALPGIVNEEACILKIAPNLELKNVDFAQYASIFGVPICIENEANAAAMAELKLGIVKELRNLVYVSILLKGIGTGIVVGGQLYKGKHKRAGEYGHTTVASQGRQCACGRRDCWELYASGNALLQGYAQRTGKSLETVAQFFDILHDQEPAAKEAFDEYLEYLALGIEDIILVQDPHYVILGGILAPFKEVLLPPLQEKIFRENNFYDGTDMKVMCSTLQGNSAILGAVLLPCQGVLC